MSRATHDANVERVLALIADRRHEDRRIIVAIAGPPASGKTTLAKDVVKRLKDEFGETGAALLPMDGYHLDNDTLSNKGLLARKGAVETFDQPSYCAAIKQASLTHERLLLPSFDRDQDAVVPRSICLEPETKIVVTEGNYLLLDRTPWRDCHAYFSASVFVKAPLHVLEKRLYQRWADQGLSRDQAAQKVLGNDLPNAKLVLDESLPADLTIEHLNYDALN